MEHGDNKEAGVSKDVNENKKTAALFVKVGIVILSIFVEVM